MTLDEVREGMLLLVNKPKNWSSFDVVRKVRSIVRTKIGHGGTLDPLASGLMLVATGKFTKKLNTLQDLPKEYKGVICIGASRPSFDKETEIEQEWDISHITEADVINAAVTLTGVIEQAPPMYSAIKIDGMRSYKMVRAGELPEMKTRSQEIFDFAIEKIELPYIHFKVSCSKGTYIRSLASDFGKALGVGAFLEELTRTKVGDYLLEDAWPVEDLAFKLIELKRARRNENFQGN
jgi:tRNA pseudouridine55 synthase